MAIANTRIHMICGICGCNTEMRFKINIKGGYNDDTGEEFDTVTIICNNCSSITGLDEIAKDEKQQIKERS